MTHTLTTQHLSPEAIHQLVNYLPDYIKVALLEKSAELECSLEAQGYFIVARENRKACILVLHRQNLST